jgi:uncharacterized protein
MSTHTPFLSALVLLSAAFPVQLFRMATMATRKAVSPLVLPGVVVLVAVLAWFAAPATAMTRLPARAWWCVVAVGLGVCAPLIEFGVGWALALARGQRVGRFALHDRSSVASTTVIVSMVAVAVGEEVVFRGLGLTLLQRYLGWVTLAAIAVTAAVYGLNHLYFGWLTVAQKTVTGLLLGILFNVAGCSVLVPILAHVTQNLMVLLVVGKVLASVNAWPGSAAPAVRR